MSNNQKPRIIIVDDHLMFRQGLKAVLMAENIATVIGEAANGRDFIQMLPGLNPDIVLMDIDMPYMDGMESTQKAIEQKPNPTSLPGRRRGIRHY